MLVACVSLLVASAPAVPLPSNNVTECLAEHCIAQVKACSKDATCDAGIKCVTACKPATKACVESCVQGHLDQAMIEVGLCATVSGCIHAETVEEKGCDSIAKIDDCHKAGCSWCKSGAVPPSCKTKDEARQLPPAVFQCDGI